MGNLHSVGEQLKALRMDKGLSQQKFGDRFGIPQRTIQNWEYGNNEPPAYVFEMLKRLIEMDNMHIYSYVLTERTSVRDTAKYTFFDNYEDARQYANRRWNRFKLGEQGRFITTKGARFDVTYSEVEWKEGRFVIKEEEEKLWDIIYAQKKVL